MICNAILSPKLSSISEETERSMSVDGISKMNAYQQTKKSRIIVISSLYIFPSMPSELLRWSVYMASCSAVWSRESTVIGQFSKKQEVVHSSFSSSYSAHYAEYKV